LSLPDLKEKRHITLPRESGSDGALDVRYSADGRWLGVLLHAGVALVDLASGEVTSAFLVATPPEGIRFATDGRMAVFGRSSLYVGPITTNDLATATRKTGGQLWDVEFRQDGSLLFLGEGLDADLEANLE
jgi:hypothetical protein